MGGRTGGWTGLGLEAGGIIVGAEVGGVETAAGAVAGVNTGLGLGARSMGISLGMVGSGCMLGAVWGPLCGAVLGREAPTIGTAAARPAVEMMVGGGGGTWIKGTGMIFSETLDTMRMSQ
jgi:hypothetical protein